MKNAIIATPTIPIKQGYDDIVSQLHRNAGGAGNLPPNIPDFESVRSMLQRTKAQQVSPIPHDINQINFPSIYSETLLRKRYLLHQNNALGVAIHAFFIRNRFIRNWYYDRQNVKKLLVLPQITRIELRNCGKDILVKNLILT